MPKSLLIESVDTGDWVRVYIDGILIAENHTIGLTSYEFQQIAKVLGLSVVYREVSE